MEKDIVSLILNNSNIKIKYINLLKQKILEENEDEDNDLYIKQSKLTLEKISLILNNRISFFDNIPFDKNAIMKVLGKIEITLDKNTIVGVGYSIIYKIIKNFQIKEFPKKHIILDEELIKKLYNDGVVVIPVFDKKELEYFHNSFIKEINNFPEYLDNLQDISYGKRAVVMGGFGALGNPSSFHNSTSREFRRKIMEKAIPFFKDYVNKYLHDKKVYLEQLFDRLSVRVEGTATTKESWHRDVAPLKKEFPNDLVFGGWVNLDLNNDQFFSCVPKTHLEKSKKAGFIQEKTQAELEKEYRPLSQKIKCPPGHWICFFQNIMHEVLAIKQKKGISIKQYCGWRLTEDDNSLFSTIDKAIENHGLPQIPSGQIPWMYTSSHMQFHQNKLIEWSNQNFRKQCLEEKTNKNGEKYLVVKRFLPSLKELNLDIYEKYDKKDINIMKPKLIS